MCLEGSAKLPRDRSWFRSRLGNWIAPAVRGAIGRVDHYRDVRIDMLRIAMRFAAWSSVEGDYLEFGVFEGNTFANAYKEAGRAGLSGMRFHAFDSFEGLPAPAGVDSRGFVQFREGEYTASRLTFDRTLRKRHVDRRRVTITPGWFSDTLDDERPARIGFERAAVVWIDCDLYESTVPVLRFITPHLQDGAVLIFDDWFCYRARPDRGEQLAVAEWLASEPSASLVDFREFGWHGKAFIFHSDKG